MDVGRVGALLGLMVAVVSACGAKPAPPGMPASAHPSAASGSAGTVLTAAPPKQVVAGPFTLQVPPDWHARQAPPNPSGNWTLDYLGPGTLPDACEAVAGDGSVCHPWPVVRLDPGGILVAVRQFGMPGSRPPSGGDPITIGGLPARRIEGPASEPCRAVGGSTSTLVVVPSVPGSQGWFGLEACVAGPDVAPAETTFSAIVASATVSAGSTP